MGSAIPNCWAPLARQPRAGTLSPAMTFGSHSFRGVSSAVGEVDFRLARRHVLNEIKRGRLAIGDACDAHPELVRSASAVGTPATEPCPVCAGHSMVLVSYVFGAGLPANGKLISSQKDLDRVNTPDRTLYVVEVCLECKWNHLIRQTTLAGRRRSRSKDSATQ